MVAIWKRNLMSKKLIFFTAICLGILTLLLSLNLFFSQSDQVINPKNWQGIEDRQKVSVLLANHELFVEVVNSSASITQGLSGRSEIGADGMLFVLPTQQTASFWMKDMKFALDFVWINDQKVVDITTNVQPPLSNQDFLPTYSPNKEVDMVLELPAGKVEELEVKIGDSIQLKN